MEIKITKCELCKTEHRSDENRHWSSVMGKCIFSVKGVAGLQAERVFDHLCLDCAKTIYDKIQCTIVELGGHV